MKKQQSKSKSRRETILWLVGFAALLAFTLGWPLYALFSSDTPMLARAAAAVVQLIFLGVVIGGFLFEARRKRVIRKACAAEGFGHIGIQRRKTHYLVSLEGPAGREVRKCRAGLKSLEWLA